VTASLNLTDENIERIATKIAIYHWTHQCPSYTATATVLKEERDPPITYTVKVRPTDQGPAYNAIREALIAANLLFSIERSES
jgi:hypothetical protein